MKNFGGGKKPFTPKFSGPKGASKPERKEKHKPPKSLKNQVRSLERLLKADRLESWVKVKKEEELQGLKKQLDEHNKQELEKKYAKRYHHVRFFERVKIERSISKLERKAEPGSEGAGAALSAPEQARLEQLKSDLQYVIHFPKGEKFVSLLKNAEDPEAQAHVEAERARLRQLVQQQLQEQAAVTEADEGRALMGGSKLQGLQGAKVESQLKASAGSKRKTDRSNQEQGGAKVEDDDDEDDFFLGVSEDEEEHVEQQEALTSKTQGQRRSEQAVAPVTAAASISDDSDDEDEEAGAAEDAEDAEDVQDEEDEEEGGMQVPVPDEEGEPRVPSTSGRFARHEGKRQADKGRKERKGSLAGSGGRQEVGAGQGVGNGDVAARGRGSWNGGKGLDGGVQDVVGKGGAEERKPKAWLGRGQDESEAGTDENGRGMAGHGRSGKVGGRGKGTAGRGTGKKKAAQPVRSREEGGRKRRK